MTRPIYLDYQATTPCDPRALAAMLPYFSDIFGNPHSAEHSYGRDADTAVEHARSQIAALIGADPREIIFTSGATEANNLAIKGAARFASNGTRRRVITFATEHKCVLQSATDLAADGFDPVILPVGPDGLHNPEALTEALRVPTLLVSCMAVNNETGVMQDITAIGEAARAAGALMHSDLAQAAGRIPIDVTRQNLDLASISAHKLYGPKGIGALYVRRRPRARIAPLFSGGSQERGLRPGTIPTPLAVGFGTACEIAAAGMAEDQARAAILRATFWDHLSAAIPNLTLNARQSAKIAGSLSLRLPQITALDLIAACPEIAMSTGSACTSADIAPSHVLTAMGLTPTQAARCLRVCVGRFTSAPDINQAAAALAAAHARLTASP